MEEKIFKADFRKLLFFSIIPVLVAIWLISRGVKNLKYFPGADPLGTVLFCVVPLTLGAIIILALLILFFGNLGKKIILTPDNFAFLHGKNEFVVSWKNLIFTPPSPHKKYFRQITFSDGKKFGKIDSLFFPELDLIEEVTRTAKRSSREKAFEI